MPDLLLDRRAAAACGIFLLNMGMSTIVRTREHSSGEWKVCVVGLPIQDVVDVLESFYRASFNVITHGAVFHIQRVITSGGTWRPDRYRVGFVLLKINQNSNRHRGILVGSQSEYHRCANIGFWNFEYFLSSGFTQLFEH